MGPKRTTKTLKLPDQETFKKYIKTVVNKTKSSLRALCEKKYIKSTRELNCQRMSQNKVGDRDVFSLTLDYIYPSRKWRDGECSMFLCSILRDSQLLTRTRQHKEQEESQDSWSKGQNVTAHKTGQIQWRVQTIHFISLAIRFSKRSTTTSYYCE